MTVAGGRGVAAAGPPSLNGGASSAQTVSGAGSDYFGSKRLLG